MHKENAHIDSNSLYSRQKRFQEAISSLGLGKVCMTSYYLQSLPTIFFHEFNTIVDDDFPSDNTFILA